MNSFPCNFIANNITEEYKNKEIFYYYMSKIREQIYLFVLENDLSKDFYDLDSVLRGFNIKNKEIYRDTIIKELETNGFIVHKIFGDTGLLIGKNDDDLKNSTWRTSIDNVIT